MTTTNLKRPIDNDEHLQNSRKYPKLLTQALKDEVKVEYQDHSIISPSTAIAATKQLNQVNSKQNFNILFIRAKKSCPNRTGNCRLVSTVLSFKSH
jgi:hypothetical protein